MLIDMHIHSNASSCSSLSFEDIVESASKKGLSGICITDHDTRDARIVRKSEKKWNGLTVIVGMEYATPQGDLLIFGPAEMQIPAMLSAMQVIEMVELSGGTVVLAHPFRTNRPASEILVSQSGVFAVEGVNGRNSDWENRMVRQWTSRHNIPAVGGSDAHTKEEIGQVATLFTVPVNNWQDLVMALKNNQAIAVDFRSFFPASNSPRRMLPCSKSYI